MARRKASRIPHRALPAALAQQARRVAKQQAPRYVGDATPVSPPVQARTTERTSPPSVSPSERIYATNEEKYEFALEVINRLWSDTSVDMKKARENLMGLRDEIDNLLSLDR